jgi:hypothetical protein
MSSLWDDVKTYDGGNVNNGNNEITNADGKVINKGNDIVDNSLSSNAKTIIGLGTVAGVAVLYLVFRAVQKKKRENA